MTKLFLRIVLAGGLGAGVVFGTGAMAQDAKPDMKPDAKAEMSKPDMSKSEMSKPEMGKPAKDMSAAQAALRERQKTCGAEWKTVKASGKAEPGMKWPKFWSACNTRLKGEKKA